MAQTQASKAKGLITRRTNELYRWEGIVSRTKTLLARPNISTLARYDVTRQLEVAERKVELLRIRVKHANESAKFWVKHEMRFGDEEVRATALRIARELGIEEVPAYEPEPTEVAPSRYQDDAGRWRDQIVETTFGTVCQHGVDVSEPCEACAYIADATDEEEPAPISAQDLNPDAPDMALCRGCRIEVSPGYIYCQGCEFDNALEAGEPWAVKMAEEAWAHDAQDQAIRDRANPDCPRCHGEGFRTFMAANVENGPEFDYLTTEPCPCTEEEQGADVVSEPQDAELLAEDLEEPEATCAECGGLLNGYEWAYIPGLGSICRDCDPLAPDADISAAVYRMAMAS